MIRTITIFKDEILYDIDALLQKCMDVNEENLQTSYKIRTDSGELDRGILIRKMDLRDADMRTFMQRYLTETEKTAANDAIGETEGSYVYSLDMPDTWPGSMLEPLTQYIHNYIVYAVLYDYFRYTVPQFLRNTDPQEFEKKINGILNRRTGAVRRPLQPF